MKTLGIVWNILINLFTIWVILTVFNVVSGQFQTLVISILVIIYLTLTSFFAMWGVTQLQTLQALATDLFGIKKLLKKNLGEDGGSESEEEMQSDFDKHNGKIITKFYINTVFSSIAYIIALFNLFGAINGY